MYTINLKINKLLSIWLISMFFIIALMIIVGGLTRLTDSGLSITEWQLFSGILPPLNHNEWICTLIYIRKFLNLNCKILICHCKNLRLYFGGNGHIDFWED